MKIIKYKKMSKGRYKVFLDNNKEIILYEDIILKYNLLITKQIDDNIFEKIISDNNEYSVYDLALSYINTKIRCEKEIRNYLERKNIDSTLINETIKKLKNNNFLDEISYIKAFTYDKFNLNNYGLNKIKRELISLNLDRNLIEEYSIIDKEEELLKLEKLIDKKIKQMKNYAGSVLELKITNYFYEQGYEKNDIKNILKTKNLVTDDLYIKEYDKLKKKYSKKYSGNELERIIKQKLYLKGFRK